MKQLASIFGGIIFSVLCIIGLCYILALPPRDITIKDINQAGASIASPGDHAIQETILIDSPETFSNNKGQVDYYIIVGSFRDITRARQGANELINDFNKNVIILPSSTEGNYRISYGKYSTPEEANAIIESIRTSIKSDAWILTEKK